MEVRTAIDVYGGSRPYTLVIEPWAEEFVVTPGDRCQVVAVHDTELAAFGLDHHAEYLVVWINRGGSTFEFWRNGRRET